MGRHALAGNGAREESGMRIVVTSNELHAFSKRWPCCEFPDGLGVAFGFDSHGLNDIEWFNAWSGKTVSEPELSEETQRALLAVS